MKEIRDILKAYDKAIQQGRQTALATVVHVDGSSYRRPGARMLVTDEGQLTGAISGGCLEGDALRKAMFAISRQQSMIVTYDTTDEDDAKLGVGLGCNGIIQVLIEPVDPADPNNPIALLKELVAERKNAVIVTLFSLAQKREKQHGTCLLFKADHLISHFHGAAPIQQWMLEDSRKALAAKKSSYKNYISGKDNLHAFIEFIRPVVSLVVIGAGNDVIPLIDMANLLGWETTVADGRTSYAKPENFAGGCRIIVARPEKVLENIKMDEQTVFALMTHNYNYDIAILRELIKSDVPYIGSLGPKQKLDRMINELKAEGIVLSAEQLSHIYGPSGLHIGAETPEEIALSIIAEIQMVLSGKPGGMLRNQDEVIHPRSDTHIETIHMDK